MNSGPFLLGYRAPARTLGRPWLGALLRSMVAAGVPMEEVMGPLGHVDTRMLERVYLHRVRRTVEAAAEPMERLFGAR